MSRPTLLDRHHRTPPRDRLDHALQHRWEGQTSGSKTWSNRNAQRQTRSLGVSEVLVARPGVNGGDLSERLEQFMAALHRFGKVDRDGYEGASYWPVSSTDQIAALRLCASRPCHATGSKPQS